MFVCEYESEFECEYGCLCASVSAKVNMSMIACICEGDYESELKSMIL